MNRSFRKSIWIGLLCISLVLLPTATAWGFGKNSKSTVIPKSTPVPTTIFTPVPKPVPTNAPLSGITAEEQQMVKLVNQVRANAGLQALQVDHALARTARLKSQDMVNLNYFAHQSPTYGSPFDMMSKFGIAFQTAGENIACNQTVNAAQQALMNSEGHRANILNESFVYIGIGIVNGGPCGQMYTEQFVGR
jgi:uncharacterized YkwD family protein